MKNWLLALFGSFDRAAPMVPRSKLALLLNSAGRSGYFEPPVPVPVGIAGLRHEARDDAMEHDAVVEAFAGELLHPLDMLRREIRAKQDGDAAVLEVEQHHILQRIGGKAQAWRGTGDGDEDSGYGKNTGEHHAENFLFKATATWAGTKAVTSPPMAAIWRTKLAAM